MATLDDVLDAWVDEAGSGIVNTTRGNITSDQARDLAKRLDDLADYADGRVT